ncbi:MAG: helix-turn-helix transcriptional regulator [Lachnospiraceae bacterium]|nr:helix-turn-helix transcriptional regulator [Lachnospiraceae bacterium]
MTLGKKIQKLRKEKNWTQEELAERLGVSSQAVSKWETDISSPDILLLRPLAELMGISVDYLLNPDEEERAQVWMAPEKQKKKLEDMILHLSIVSADEDIVKLNLPMPLVQMFLEIGLEMPKVKNKEILEKKDLEKILLLVEKGAMGKLLEIQSGDGDLIEIVVE